MDILRVLHSKNWKTHPFKSPITSSRVADHGLGHNDSINLFKSPEITPKHLLRPQWRKANTQ